ncbi:hypothetical protein ONE63_003384 [Megalurothrips usitatus]|uniref:Mutator-like transposase domain-containing protein n=1 Tax=Megalurothrips usitatus TaxID=439358 RepID=A0AAV7XA37_9NEOP|nr:hypothetical protein ONE63_003384 [Megalurothrips usitatus]
MEADIIAEGFLQSTQLNLKYSTIIADNDSSVYPRLMALQPYGPQCPVKKIECKNHLSRNYRKNLKAIGDRTEFPLLLRKFLQSGFPSRHVKIVNAMWTAALHWKDSSDYFCQGPKEGEVDMVENCLRPENRKFWDAVVGLANHYAGFADSLIYCLDNNLAERFNNVVAQKINGKRVNHNQRGGVLTRGLAAVASVNTSGRYHEAVHRAAVGAAPLGESTLFLALALFTSSIFF